MVVYQYHRLFQEKFHFVGIYWIKNLIQEMNTFMTNDYFVSLYNIDITLCYDEVVL